MRGGWERLGSCYQHIGQRRSWMDLHQALACAVACAQHLQSGISMEPVTEPALTSRCDPSWRFSACATWTAAPAPSKAAEGSGHLLQRKRWLTLPLRCCWPLLMEPRQERGRFRQKHAGCDLPLCPQLEQKDMWTAPLAPAQIQRGGRGSQVGRPGCRRPRRPPLACQRCCSTGAGGRGAAALTQLVLHGPLQCNARGLCVIRF